MLCVNLVLCLKQRWKPAAATCQGRDESQSCNCRELVISGGPCIVPEQALPTKRQNFRVRSRTTARQAYPGSTRSRRVRAVCGIAVGNKSCPQRECVLSATVEAAGPGNSLVRAGQAALIARGLNSTSFRPRPRRAGGWGARTSSTGCQTQSRTPPGGDKSSASMATKCVRCTATTTQQQCR